MTFTVQKTRFKEIRPGDEHFRMTDGIRLVPRASIEVNQRCPENYKSLIQECINHGWIKPIAYVKEKELFWEVLGD